MSKRDFEEWISTFEETVANYKYYVDFETVYKNTNKLKVEINILNSLIGSKNIEEEFKKIITEYPKTLGCIPILVAVRENTIRVQDVDNGLMVYNFKNKNYSLDQYAYFMRESGLFDLLENHLIGNLYDYVTGCNAGLNSNARKNRTGDCFEDIVEGHIRKAGFVKGKTYFKEMYTEEVTEKFGTDFSALTEGDTRKRFDFVVKPETSDTVYGIECNFYSTGGSKPNETARSYKKITEESKDIENFEFVWFTDGVGWHKAKNNLHETFLVLDNLYSMNDMSNGIMNKLFKK